MKVVELPKLPKVSDVAKATSVVMDVPLSEIYGDGRTQIFVRARWVISYIARRSLLKSYPVIGNCINRDHTTVLHGVRSLQKMIDGGDQKMSDIINQVKQMVGIPGDAALLESIKRWEKRATAHTNPMLRSFASTIHRDILNSTEKSHEV
jgi:hypothetical protein